jgi:tRNA modification GTPase
VSQVDDVTRQIHTHTQAPVIGVLTKADLVTERPQIGHIVTVSARTGEGLAVLLDAIDTQLALELGTPLIDEAPGLTRARHRAAAETAVRELEAFDEALGADVLPMSIAAIHVRHAADALGELIGAVHTEDVLDVVFRQFCVGK